MDKRICVYEVGESDYASNGLGTISPTKCLVHWEENNEYSAEIEHPIDSLGKYERLNVCGRTVVIPVPEAPSMRLNRTGSTTSVAIYTIATRKSRLRLRSGPGTNYKCLGYYAKGSKVTLINQTTASWYEVTAQDGKHGWMSADYLSFSHNQTVGSVTTEILRDLPMRPQPFDIYAIDPGLDAVSVKVRHVFYRLAENLVCSLEIKNKTAQQALDAVFAAAEYQDHGFNWYCEDTQAMSLEDVIEGKNIVDIILGDGGICETYGLKLLVDWFDIFLVKEIGQDRGVQLRYAKNLQGLEGGIDASNVVTRVVPVGQTKDGKPLYLSGQKYVESSNASSYPRPIYGYLRVSDAKVDSEVNGQTVTTASARAMMQDAAQAELDAGCDLPDCSITATMTQLRYDPAYADYAELERICPGDTLGLFVPNFGLALSIRLSGYAFDALNQSYNEMTLGSPRTNMTNAGISARQLGGMSVTASKIAPGAVSAPALADDIVATRHIQADSINTDALQAACVTALKIAAGSIDAGHISAGAINASHISAEALDAIAANIDWADIQWADIENLSARIAEIAKAQITQANIEDADIDWANIANLTAAVAEIAEAKIAGATIGTAQIDDLEAVVAEITHAQVATGEFDFAEVENFLGSVFILGQGIAGTVSIENLMVTRANMLNATVQTLILPGTDGKYYQITVGTDGQLSTEEVTVTDSEIAAGETEDGRQIVATTINADTINGSTITAQQAILNTVLTQALTAGKITAGEALIASASIPTLYVTSVEALGNSMTFSANEQIQMIVGNVQQAQETADSAQEAAEQAAPYISATPPETAPEAGKLWLDEGVEPSVLRKWRGADVTTEREYTEMASGAALLTLDNGAGQIKSVAVEAGCRTRQAGTGDPSPENIRAISGRDSVEIAACGKNLYDVSDRLTFSDGVTVDADGWINVTADNSAGSSNIFKNCFTYPSLAIRPSTQYAAVCEIAQINVTGQLAFYIVDLYNEPHTLSQFAQGFSLTVNENTQTGTRIQVVTSHADLSDAGSMLRTYVAFTPGASGTIKFRLSVLADTAITAETFEYEPYRSMGGGTIAPTEPLYGLPGAEDRVEVSVDGDVLVTRRTAVLEMDGTESGLYIQTASSGIPRLVIPPQQPAKAPPNSNTLGNAKCSHYQTATTAATWGGAEGFGVETTGYFLIYDANYTTSETWKSYLAAQKTAGTPVTIVYELETPQSEALSAVLPITPAKGQVNLSTDADSLTATITGSGWETVNDTSGLAGDISSTQSGLEDLSDKLDAANDAIAQMASQIITPEGIVETVEASAGYQSIKTQVEKNATGLSVTNTKVTDVDGRLEKIEGNVRIQGSEITLGRSDSPYQNTINEEGSVITEDGQEILAIRGSKMESARVQISDAIIIGGIAIKTTSDGHVYFLRR